MMICNHCGNENAENVKFCSGCGTPLVMDAQAQQGSEQPEQTQYQQPEQAQYQQPEQAQYQQPNQAQYQQPNQAQYQQPNQAQYQQPNQAQYQQPNQAQYQQPNQAQYQQPNQAQYGQPNQAQYGQPNQAQYQQPEQAQYQQPNQAQYQQPNQAQYGQGNPYDDAQQNKAVYSLTYIPILFFLPLLAAPGSPIGKFHANQSLLILFTSIALGIVNAFLGIALRLVPIFGVLFASLLSLAIYAVTVTLVIVGMVNASKGMQKPLPVIGNIFTIIK